MASTMEDTIKNKRFEGSLLRVWDPRRLTNVSAPRAIVFGVVLATAMFVAGVLRAVLVDSLPLSMAMSRSVWGPVGALLVIPVVCAFFRLVRQVPHLHSE